MHLPDWALAVAYWLHMLATIVWLGGLSSLAIFVIPAARRSLSQDGYAAFLARIQDRLQQIGWLCLAVLVGTGMFQMSSHPAYQGFLAIRNPWSVAILSKHILVGVMIVASAYITWGITPALRRIALVKSAGKTIDENEQAGLQRREMTMLRVNLVLSVLVLLLTALARTS